MPLYLSSQPKIVEDKRSERVGLEYNENNQIFAKVTAILLNNKLCCLQNNLIFVVQIKKLPQ